MQAPPPFPVKSDRNLKMEFSFEYAQNKKIGLPKNKIDIQRHLKKAFQNVAVF